MLVLSQTEGMQLLVRHYEDLTIFGTQSSSFRYLGKWEKIIYFSDFFQVKPNYEHYKKDSARRIIAHHVHSLCSVNGTFSLRMRSSHSYIS